jgi:hypothetical protein
MPGKKNLKECSQAGYLEIRTVSCKEIARVLFAISNIRSKTQLEEKTRKKCYHPTGQCVTICEGIIVHTTPMPSSPHIRDEIGNICARKCP